MIHKKTVTGKNPYSAFLCNSFKIIASYLWTSWTLEEYCSVFNIHVNDKANNTQEGLDFHKKRKKNTDSIPSHFICLYIIRNYTQQMIYMHMP